MTKVFVYGTLKRAYHNNRYLKGSRFLGEALTVDNFDMLDVGFPVLLPQRGDVAYPVKGELYEIDDTTLKNLDRLEGEGRMYQRQTRTVLSMDDPITGVHAYIYVGIPTEDRWDWGEEVKPVPTACGALVRGDGFVAYDWEPRQFADDEEIEGEEELLNREEHNDAEEEDDT